MGWFLYLTRALAQLLFTLFLPRAPTRRLLDSLGNGQKVESNAESLGPGSATLDYLSFLLIVSPSFRTGHTLFDFFSSK
jgi:hypothetical protein